LVFDIARPQSVVDFGCGTGTWLESAKALGVGRVLGVEGAWIKRAKPLIAADELQIADLNVPISVPQRFDLAISLEVAEHLKPERARGFVGDLCQAANVVLFGAAIPEQGGTGHINEQWQSYWADLFAERGYRCLDVVRPKFWQTEAVLPWYKQNAFLYANDTAYEAFRSRLPPELADARRPLDMVHPDLYTRLVRDPPLRLGARISWAFAGKVLKKAFGLAGASAKE